jgi:hypothetical protein
LQVQQQQVQRVVSVIASMIGLRHGKVKSKKLMFRDVHRP